MSIAGVEERGKGGSLVEMAEGLGELVEQAARTKTSLREFERNVLDRLLAMGHAATEQFLAMQGNGDQGETVTDEQGRTLYRSHEPARRPLRTIFGEHQFEAYVYRRRRRCSIPTANIRKHSPASGCCGSCRGMPQA